MRYVTLLNGRRYEIDIQKDGSLLVNGEPRTVDFRTLAPSLYSVITDSQSYELAIEQTSEEIQVQLRGRLYSVNVLDERAQLLASRSGGIDTDSGEISIKSPMPGLIVAITVSEGQEIKSGQTIVILESMKMQNELKAPRDGVIQRISVTAGQTVEQNKLLITIV
jgi:biotin carboxyl carrier protein